MHDTSAKAATLRHGLTCLWPSEIAEQFYCEYKAHLKRIHPEHALQQPDPSFKVQRRPDGRVCVCR
jgi:hypothetical protein